LYVQLANFKAPKETPADDEWAELREAQSMALRYPKTGMAVTIDIGETNDIHPKNKAGVGKRLYLAARKIAYNEDVVCSGPVYKSMTVEGSAIRLKFSSTGSGLATTRNEAIKGFAIAGADQKFYWADAEIDGDDVVVHSKQVLAPLAVRYAWAANPTCNLYNKEGLPAVPFRTDNWKLITQP
jgi:sialate O-acetylesterase